MRPGSITVMHYFSCLGRTDMDLTTIELGMLRRTWVFASGGTCGFESRLEVGGGGVNR
jgi:hypothetical protein